MTLAYELQNIPTLAALLQREAQEPMASLPADVNLPSRLLERALFEPLKGAALRPGKEFRGRLTDIAWELAGGKGGAPVELAGCVEALHLGSLIVDDIEDNSPRRRGAPSLHHVAGVPLALNAGNFLYFFPSVLLARLRLERDVELSLKNAMDRAILHCHYGQALDLSVRVTELRRREIPNVVLSVTRLKTGSLMQLAAEIGAIAARGDEGQVECLAKLGRELGIALQMLDDLTGITCVRRCHKGHEDLLEARPSWVWAWLAESEDDIGYLRLRALEEQVVHRELHPEVVAAELRGHVAEHGFSAVRARLRGARAELESAFPEGRAVAALREEIERLERYDG
jgi:geranylgeranyl pyrophosphate synthase